MVKRLPLDSPGDFTGHVLRAALLHARIPGFQREPAPGQTFYQRAVPVPGQPGALRSFVGDLWMVPFEREADITAVLHMLQTGSDEPMQALLSREPMSLEKMWQEFSAVANAPNLRRLFRDPAYRDKAVVEVNRQYAALPAIWKISEAMVQVIAAKAALGDENALSWLLRSAGMQKEEDGDSLGALQSTYRALFDREIAPREVPDFIRNCRRWISDDFRYDAEKMIWVFNAATTSPPTKP